MQQFQIPKVTAIDVKKLDSEYLDDANKFSEERMKFCGETSAELQAQLLDFFKNEVNIRENYVEDLIYQIEEYSQQLGAQKRNLQQVQSQINLKVQQTTDAVESFKATFQQQDLEYQQQQDSIQTKKTQIAEINKKRILKIKNIKPAILYKMDLPNDRNKTLSILNWILGCLYQEELSVEQFLIKRGYKIKGHQQKGGCFAFCGGSSKKPKKDEEEVNPWSQFKDVIFKEYEGREFLQNLSKLSPENLQDFQIMLMEELLQEKKDIIASFKELDIKFQVRSLLEVVESVMEGKAIQDKIDQDQLLLGNQKDKMNLKATTKQENEEMKADALKLQEAYVNLLKVIDEEELMLVQSKQHYDTILRNNERTVTTIDDLMHDQQNEITKKTEQMEQIFKDEERGKQTDQLVQMQLQQQEFAATGGLDGDNDNPMGEDQLNQEEKQEEQVLPNFQEEKFEPQAQKGQEEEEEKEDPLNKLAEGMATNQKALDDQGLIEEEKIEPSKDPLEYNVQATLFPNLLRTQKNTDNQNKKNQSIFQIIQQGKKKKAGGRAL